MCGVREKVKGRVEGRGGSKGEGGEEGEEGKGEFGLDIGYGRLVNVFNALLYIALKYLHPTHLLLFI